MRKVTPRAEAAARKGNEWRRVCFRATVMRRQPRKSDSDLSDFEFPARKRGPVSRATRSSLEPKCSTSGGL